MKIGHVSKTEIRIHPALFLVVIGAGILGMLKELFEAFAALTLHELFHAAAAHALGCRVASIELQPFGGVARLSEKTLSPRTEFAVAMAGPVCSLSIGASLAAVSYFAPEVGQRLFSFMQTNLTLGLLNLLPALPLDGGRMLRCIFSRILKPRAATLLAAWLGVLFGAGMLGLGIYFLTKNAFNFTLFTMGGFLLFAAIRELQNSSMAQMGAILRRQDALYRGECLPLRHCAVHKSLRAGEALAQLCANRYNLLLIVNDDMHALGELDEMALLSGIAQKGADAPVESLLQKSTANAPHGYRMPGS